MTTLQRILHVEDDESIITITRVALETVGGLTVLSCTRGREAIEQAAEFAPDLLLLDVMMPDMDGPTTLAGLAEVIDVARYPVVFMTARANSDDHRAYYDLGAAAVVVKPFDPMTLADQLKTIWNRFNGSER
ncbi:MULTISPECIES: response regulator [Modicisalibacter]|uniref:response regulator n=1 Tax=Modicisalibacter TaxID=574347 RepID=UPI00100B2BF6|nr:MULTISPECIES: response regulator [Halomonadaceae]MBZ9559962.1 response regulator [Modicisalibacter sp. R2A 31.J]MBZ9575870.1 response regulator [Modicisalibacter sp. MOD 31.J]